MRKSGTKTPYYKICLQRHRDKPGMNEHETHHHSFCSIKLIRDICQSHIAGLCQMVFSCNISGQSRLLCRLRYSESFLRRQADLIAERSACVPMFRLQSCAFASRSQMGHSSHDLMPNQGLQLLLAQLLLVSVKLEELLWNGLCSGFIVRVMIWLQIGMLQCLLDCDSLYRVECQ